MVWYGRDSWLSKHPPSKKDNLENGSESSSNEQTKLLNDKMSDIKQVQSINTVPSNLSSLDVKNGNNRTIRYKCVSIARCLSILYIVCGLIIFAVGFFLRTATFIAILGPFSCLLVVMTTNEYYRLKRTDNCRDRTLCCRM